MKTKIGVLVMSYGTPESMEGIEAYYTHIRRGHAPSPEQLEELSDRYKAIVGGVFPLRENTNNQVENLQEALDTDSRLLDVEYVCYQGLKHASPFIEDGVEQMAKDGIKKAVGIVLAPHYSTMSVESYVKRAQAKADEVGVQFTFVKSYHLHPQLIEAFSRRVNAKLDLFKEAGAERGEVRVLFSAHSLPERILSMGDPYPEQLLETSRAIAEQTGVTSWQLHGKAPGAPPSRGLVRTSSIRCGTSAKSRSKTCWSLRSASYPTISKCCTTWISKPRKSPKSWTCASCASTC
ncbi:Ferrochelatase 1 [Paenibacillus sp. P1XP2]|nr:Ferrochelatase 1 [Paenibacillus sp. P1XP2]